MQEFEYYFPAVDPVDLKLVWMEYTEHPGCAIGTSLLARLCSPGADIHAISHRYAMLTMLRQLPTDLLADKMRGGQLDDVVFKVAATIPLERREIGVEYDGLPFDADEFVRRLRDEANS
jgi:hypothetical protein